MSIDEFIGSYRHSNWLAGKPLGLELARRYIKYLQNQRYCELTVRHYMSALAHFNYWASAKPLAISNITETTIVEFVYQHLPTCTCPRPCFRGRLEIAAALRCLLLLLHREGLIEPESPAETPISVELQLFHHYLTSTRGLAPSTCAYQLRFVRRFLDAHFGVDPIDLARLSPQRVDDWIIGFIQRYRPGSLGVVRTSLRSYFRFRALCGDATESLCAALPILACWGETKLIETMTDSQLKSFLRSFDLSYPTGLRDYAMARCLSDLGLRGHEVTQLALDSIDWRAGTMTLHKTKGQRVRVLPLPVATGAAIAKYLREGRPRTVSRRLFVRHVAPYDKPLGRCAAAHAMNRTLARSALGSEFSGTHVLRRTMATRLQCCDTSLKVIADMLGHRELQSTTRYVKVDFERLRRIALPWRGSQP